MHWPVATVLDSRDVEHFCHCRNFYPTALLEKQSATWPSLCPPISITYWAPGSASQFWVYQNNTFYLLTYFLHSTLYCLLNLAHLFIRTLTHQIFIEQLFQTLRMDKAEKFLPMGSLRSLGRDRHRPVNISWKVKDKQAGYKKPTE